MIWDFWLNRSFDLMVEKLNIYPQNTRLVHSVSSGSGSVPRTVSDCSSVLTICWTALCRATGSWPGPLADPGPAPAATPRLIPLSERSSVVEEGEEVLSMYADSRGSMMLMAEEEERRLEWAEEELEACSKASTRALRRLTSSAVSGWKRKRGRGRKLRGKQRETRTKIEWEARNREMQERKNREKKLRDLLRHGCNSSSLWQTTTSIKPPQCPTAPLLLSYPGRWVPGGAPGGAEDPAGGPAATSTRSSRTRSPDLLQTRPCVSLIEERGRGHGGPEPASVEYHEECIRVGI